MVQKYKNKDDWDNVFFKEEKTLKTGNKKKENGWKKKKNYQVNAIFKNKYIRTIKKV